MTTAATGSAADFLPPRINLTSLRVAVQECRGCSLYRRATRAVFGEGLRRARLVLVGEQPGDREDLAGRPFVGPAGRLLDEALEEAGIDRSQAFVTNAVKHFKWEARGKRRKHQSPSSAEIEACRPWLDAELQVVRPEALVAMGATAARALLGREFRVTRQRGEFVPSPLAEHVTATVHPAAILRMPDRGARRAAREEFVDDLRAVAARLGGARAQPPASA
jgi:uracil-DNA glycosylase